VEAAWRETLSWYIVAATDRAVPPSLERTMAKTIYVAAFARETGESAGLLRQMTPPPLEVAEVRPDAAGFLKLTEVGVRQAFAQDVSEAVKAVLFAAQAPTAATAALGGVVTEPAWRTNPGWYPLAGEDRAIQPDCRGPCPDA